MCSLIYWSQEIEEETQASQAETNQLSIKQAAGQPSWAGLSLNKSLELFLRTFHSKSVGNAEFVIQKQRNRVRGLNVTAPTGEFADYVLVDLDPAGNGL